MKTTIQRNVRTALCSTLLLLSALGAAGQGTFQNLGFEDTTLTPVLVNPGSGFYVTNATHPGWGVYGFPYGNPTTISYDDIALDAPAVTLQGTDSRSFPAIQGDFSVLL